MKKILFIRLRLLGDIIFTIPALEIYKKHFPENKIYYVVEEKFREIAELIPGIHEMIVLPRKMTLKEHFKFRKKIKILGIDTVVDFHSGSLHLASLTATPLVTLYGPNIPEISGPWQEKGCYHYPIASKLPILFAAKVHL